MVEACVKEWKPYYSEASLSELDRKLRQLSKELEKLRSAGKVATIDPKRIGEAEIGALIVSWRERGLEASTQFNYLRYLAYFLRECGNSIIDRMRKRNRNLPRAASDKELVALTIEQLQRIWTACESLVGWRREVARFIFRAYAFTGLRNKELRLAHFEDLNTETWSLRVRHPKGEGSWGRQRVSLLPPPLVGHTLDFLRAREEWLRVQGIYHAEPLIPSPCTRQAGGGPGFYTSHGFEAMKLKLEELSGVRFKIKDLRSTCAQLLKDLGVSIEAVSKQLGHASSRTTEQHYARIRDSAAHQQISEAWERAFARPDSKPADEPTDGRS